MLTTPRAWQAKAKKALEDAKDLESEWLPDFTVYGNMAVELEAVMKRTCLPDPASRHAALAAGPKAAHNSWNHKATKHIQDLQAAVDAGPVVFKAACN